MKVYIVSHGEQYEGGSVVSVHRLKKNAIKMALAFPCCFPGGWLPEGDDYWENGCDFVKVQEEKIQS